MCPFSIFGYYKFAMDVDFFCLGGGEMGALIRSIDWSKTPLGDTKQWPQSLKMHTKTMLDNKLGMYIAWGPEYIQIYNDAYRPILGSAKHPQAMGISSKETFSEIWNIIGPMFQDVMLEGKSVGFSDFMLTLDRNGDGQKEDCFFDFSYSPIYHEKGFVGGVLVTVIETTQQVKSVKNLHQRESNLRNLVINAPVGMCVLMGSNYSVEIVNEAMVELWGTQKEIVLGKPVFEALPIGRNQGIEQHLDNVYRTGKNFSGKHSLKLLRNGKTEKVYVNYSYEPFRDQDGVTTGIIAVAIDVTEQVLSKRKVEESEANLQRLVMNAPVAMCVLKEPEHKVEIVNEAMLKLWGKTKKDVLNKPIFEGLPEAKDQGFKTLLDDVYKTGNTFSASEHAVILPREGGSQTIYVNFTYDPFKDVDGNITGIIAVAIDVSEQVKARRKIEDSEANLQKIIKNAPIAMCILKGPEYVFDIVNEPMLVLLGRSRDVVFKKPIFKALPEIEELGLQDILNTVYKTATPFITEEMTFHLYRNGTLTPTFINFMYEPILGDENLVEGVIVVAIDVTSQVEARHKIEEAEERARLAIESADIGTYDIDLQTERLITSKRFDELFEFGPGPSRQDIINRYHPEDLHIRHKAYQEALEKGSSTYQVRLLFKDGSIKWVRCNGTVLFDKHRNPIRLLGTVFDVSPTVKLQQQKDDFIAIASHELKTPLTSVKGYNQILSSLVKKGDQVTSLNIIKKTERQIEKMTKLIHNFLDLSKLDSAQLKLEKEDFDLNDLVSETINYYNLPENKERLRFKKGELPPIHADKSKLGHVIDNLLSNALKYSEQDKQVIITTLVENGCAVVRVLDHGKGINTTSKNKIFQRFYRADNTVGGTTSGFGIGLYFSSEIIKLHGGKIWFESIEGEGSTFIFSIPL